MFVAIDPPYPCIGFTFSLISLLVGSPRMIIQFQKKLNFWRTGACCRLVLWKNIEYVWFARGQLSLLLTEAFHVTEWRPPSLIYMGPLPLICLAFLCLCSEEVVGELVRFLEVAMCKVNTSNYRVPVWIWKVWKISLTIIKERIKMQRNIQTCRYLIDFMPFWHIVMLSLSCPGEMSS